MTRIIRFKNNSGSDGTWVGQDITDGAYHDVEPVDIELWANDDTVLTDVGSGDLIVNKGADTTDDFASAADGWAWVINGEQFPKSEIDGDRIAVHPSYRPSGNSYSTYAVWIGAGDSTTGSPLGVVGEGEDMSFHMTPGNATVVKDIKFDRNNGRIWLHEAYIKFDNGGEGDHLSADVVASGVNLQTAVNKDLILDGDWIKYSPSGAGTGTHGFADANVQLVTRSFSKNGAWNFDTTTGALTPNMTDTGEYAMSTVDKVVHRFINHIPCHGSCPTYFSMTSDETTELRAGYYIRITCTNVSNTTWDLHALIEAYREKTHSQ